MKSFFSSNFLRLISGTALAFLSFVATAFAERQDQKMARDMAKVAEELISSIGQPPSARLCYEFKSERRQNWHFFPNWSGRTGIPLNQLSSSQRALVMNLLNLLLSSEGFADQEKVRLIHGVRKDLQAPDNPRHLYYISIFGTPSFESSWGWRMEGHHLSFNCTLVEGKYFSVTPSFWGASPVRVNMGKYKGLEVFEKECSLSLALVHSFTDGQKREASAKSDNGPDAVSRVFRDDFLDEPGIAFDQLNQSQRSILQELIFLFAKKYRPEIIEQIESRKKILDPSLLRFSYLYSQRGGYVSYFCIVSSEYLIEFDNQGGNHIHAAWRDFDGDFGRDLIGEHLESERQALP